MLIGYGNAKLKKVCTKEKEAGKHLPKNIPPRVLFRRLDQLKAFDNLGEIRFQVPPLHFHPLRENRSGKFAVTVRSLCRIVFESAGVFKRGEDGTAHKDTVTEITILEIGDYH